MEKRVRFKSAWLPWLLVAPQMAIVLVFFFWPAGQALYQSVLQEDAFGTSREFVGMANFQRLFADESYLHSFQITAVFSALVAVTGICVALLLAVMANRVVRGATVYKTLLIWPYAVAPVVAGVLARSGVLAVPVTPVVGAVLAVGGAPVPVLPMPAPVVAVALATRAAATGEAHALLVAEPAGELLEGGRHRGELLRVEERGDLVADLLDGGAEPSTGGGAVGRERPSVGGALDPAEIEERAQGAVRELAADRDRAVDDVEDPPLAAGDPLVLEGGGEPGRQQAVGGGDPEAERAALVGGCVLGCVL